MASFIGKIKRDPLYRNSIIFFIGSFVASALGYLYHLFLGRLLLPEQYGIIGSLLSMFLIVSVATNTILTVVMKYTAQYYAQGKSAAVVTMQKRLGRWLTVGSVIITGACVALSGPISRFLNIDSVWPVVFLGLSFLFIFVSPIYRGVLQGLQRFGRLSWSMIIDGCAKLFFGLLLVWLGWSVIGGVLGIVAGALLGLLTSWLFSRDTRKIPGQAFGDWRGVWTYCLPVAVVMLATTLLYSIDVILVKHYFSPAEAGLYTAVSQLGKIIVFGTAAIAGVMFPMVAAKFAEGENFRPVFWKAVGIVTGLSALAAVIYFLAPNFIIGLLYGPDYLPGASLLGYVAIFMAFYSVINVLVQFFLSIKDYGALLPLVVGCAAQIFLIVLFHQSLYQVIFIIDCCLASIVASLFVYYGYRSKKHKTVGQVVRAGPGL